MDRIAKFSRCMKELLISKRKLFGQLYNITSRTDETSLFINELIQAIVDIFQQCNIPIGVSEDGQRNKRNINRVPIVVQCYNYLLLNTRFPSQDFLRMDFLYGHIVNIWPNISPYLFIQIIWRLEYDKVLVESLQHVPLDLCAEILDITVKCLVELKSKRAISLIFNLIRRIYCKCLRLGWNVHLKNNGQERLYQLVAYFQMLLNLLDKLFNKFPEIYRKEKYTQRGILLKRIFRYTRLCMSKKLSSNVINPDVTYMADMYRLTFGNLSSEIYHKFSDYEINSVMIILDQELLALLLKKIRKTESLEYTYWKIADEKNPTISLHRAIITECYNFMIYMKKDHFLIKNDHLRQFLQRFINWSNFSRLENSNGFSLTLQELRDRIINGRPENMKELMMRYREWDNLTLNFINNQMQSLERDDLFFLFEYLHHVFANTLNAMKRNQAYMWVVIILQRVNLINLRWSVLKYTKQHFQDNYLECMYDDETFHKFIKNELNMKNPVKLHMLLIYILLNPKKVLTILVKIAIKYDGYKNLTIETRDLLLLKKFFCIKADKKYNLLLIILKEICFNNDKCNPTIFCNFIIDMMDNQVITMEDLINYFYIPYLIMTNIEHNQTHIDISLQLIGTELNYAEKINITLLITVLAKKMSLIRRTVESIKEEINDLLHNARYILRQFSKYLKICEPTIKKRKLREYKYAIGAWLEPLDQAQMLMVISPKKINVLHVLKNYETRCFPLHQKFRTNPLWEYKKKFTYCARINRESLIRHMMLRATANEFQSYVHDLIKLYYHFGWTSQLEAYENVMRIATDAIQLTMVYPKTFPPNAFVTLLHTLIIFCKKFAKKSDANSHEAICRILLKALFSLKRLMHGTRYGKLYNYMLMHIDRMYAYKNYADVKHYFHDIRVWMRACFGQFNRKIPLEKIFKDSILNDGTNSGANIKLFNMFNEYNFVSDCITLLNTEI